MNGCTFPGRDNFLSWGRRLGLHYCHRGLGHLRGYRAQLSLGVDPRANAKEQKATDDCEDHERKQPALQRRAPCRALR